MGILKERSRRGEFIGSQGCETESCGPWQAEEHVVHGGQAVLWATKPMSSVPQVGPADVQEISGMGLSGGRIAWIEAFPDRFPVLWGND